MEGGDNKAIMFLHGTPLIPGASQFQTHPTAADILVYHVLSKMGLLMLLSVAHSIWEAVEELEAETEKAHK